MKPPTPLAEARVAAAALHRPGPLERSRLARLERRIWGHWPQRVVDERVVRWETARLILQRAELEERGCPPTGCA